MNQKLLLEMAIHQEQDVFGMEPVASVSSKDTEKLENEDLRNYIVNAIKNGRRLKLPWHSEAC